MIQAHYETLRQLFDPKLAFAGYKPTTKEIPNADGVVDHGKRFLHVNLKYINDSTPTFARELLENAHETALEIARTRLMIPAELMPSLENATLRVLEYPPGEGSAQHKDFDLFTVNLWRNELLDHEQFIPPAIEGFPGQWKRGAEEYHFGELAEIFGLGQAVLHRVQPRPYAQQALVYFASPAMSTPLPEPITFPAQGNFAAKTVTTTGAWQVERTNRSRVYG